MQKIILLNRRANYCEMKKRIPFDIEFLLESIMTESPDRFVLGAAGVEKLEKLGIKRKEMNNSWTDHDAYPFFIEPKDKIVIYRHNATHGSMDKILRYAARSSAKQNAFEFGYEFSNMQGDPGFISKAHNSQDCYFHGLNASSLEDVRKYLQKHKSYFKELEIRGDHTSGDGGDESTELAGRIWADKNVVSFWNEKDNVMPYMNQVYSFMKNYNMNLETALYEFIDSRGFYTYQELTGNLPDDKEKLSPEEIQALKAQKHFKKDKADYSPSFWNRQDKKAAKGFEYPAKAAAAIPALEGHIKLKDLLKENPDKVDLKGGSGADMKIARYQDNDAVAFFAFPNFAAYYEGGTHTDIINVLYNVYGELKFKITKYADDLKIENSLSDAYSFAKEYMRKSDVHVTDFDGMVRDLQSGPLKDFFDNENIHSDDDPGGFRTKSGGLSGRLWSRKKIVSFWNVREDVIKKWNMVEQLFSQSSGKFGKLSDYKVDWLERDIREMPMTPADEISSSSGSDDNQMDFMEKLVGDSPISPEELKKLQGQLHLLSAKEKKEALLKLGYRNAKYEERAAIADKLGMTVAEFNSIMNVNENEL